MLSFAWLRTYFFGVLAATALVPTTAMAKTLSPSIYSIDCGSNIVSTTRDWWLDHSGSDPIPPLPTTEFLSTRSYQVDFVVYVKSSNISVTYDFYNPNSTALSGTFTIANAKFVHYDNSAKDRTLGGNGSQSITIPGLGHASKSFTLTNLPTSVMKGWLEWDYYVHWQTANSGYPSNGKPLHFGLCKKNSGSSSDETVTRVIVDDDLYDLSADGN